MLPPNGGMGQGIGQQGNGTPTPNFQQRPPSRTTTPQGSLMNPSPSMMSRQTPGMPQTPSGLGGGTPNNGGMGGPGGMMSPESIALEFARIPSNVLPTLRQDLGVGHDKDLAALTLDEKVCISLLPLFGSNRF